MHKISMLVGSSHYVTGADDALKDEDNAAWVMKLEPEIREEWIERISWIRLVDRLAENELMESTCSGFQEFQDGWKRLRTDGTIEKGCSHWKVLQRLRSHWFDQARHLHEPHAIVAWERYMGAIASYHHHHLVIDTLEQHETMLARLAGSFFQVLPFLSAKQAQAAYYFGIVDQFYNNLRDLREDAERGICYFPTEVLNRFGVSRTEILGLTCFKNPGYYSMMNFWLEDYLPKLRHQAYELMLAEDLHPSWQLLRDWSLHRYERIERVFRQCHFNYDVFPNLYWVEVRQELDVHLAPHPYPALFSVGTATEIADCLNRLKKIEETTKLAKFFKLSPSTVRAAKAVLSFLQTTRRPALPKLCALF